MMLKSEKKFDTGLRILEVLKILLISNFSKSEIIDILKDNSGIGSVYTNEAFIKYFNTLKVSGLKINKIKNKYELENALINIELSEEEKAILLYLLNNYKILHNKTNEEAVKTAIFKINKFLYNFENNNTIEKILLKQTQITDNIKENLIETFQKLLIDNLQVKIKYKRNQNTEEEIILELKELVEKNNNIYITGYCKKQARNKKILLDTIISVEQMPQKSINAGINSAVTFEVYGKLASLYKLKPSEKLVDFSENSRTISNTDEDKDILLKRLLKYGENCKILKPESYQKELLALTDEIIKNLEES